MGTGDVLKVLKIARAAGECNLGTCKTSRVTINHEMHEQVHRSGLQTRYSIFFFTFTNFMLIPCCTVKAVIKLEHTETDPGQ